MAQASPNFGALLDTPSQEVHAPPVFPAGMWQWRVVGQPRFDKSSKKGTEFVEFTLKPMAAGEDVDQDALNDFGSFAEKTLPATFYITEKSLFMLKEFLDHCGIPDEGSLRQRIDQAMNSEVIGFIRHEASEDGQRIFARFGRFAPVAE